MKRIFLLLAGFVAMFTVMSAPVQSRVPTTPLLQPQAQPEAEIFMGTILKSGNNFVLSDSATKTRYMLDDTRKAKPFEGRTVKVTGTLNEESNLIHVQAIQNIV
jgi:hypothetical protein